MLDPNLRLTRPGLFITGTDTGVGKTVVTCAIAWALRRQNPGAPIGVCKPFATGCRREREGLVSEDAEALAHFADCRLPLEVINPIRFAPPVAPAVAAEADAAASGNPAGVDLAPLSRALQRLDDASQFMLIEGVGGLLVPLDPRDPKVTVLDLIAELRYPVAVVCRATLGTLNHTAMTVRLLRAAGCRVAGLIVNGYEPDTSKPGVDPSMATNRLWLERMNKTPILATAPALPAATVRPERGEIPDAILETVGLTFWADVLREPGA